MRWISLVFALSACAPEPADTAAVGDVAAYDEPVFLDEPVSEEARPFNRCFAVRCSAGYTCCPIPACDICLPDGEQCSRRACSRP
jgi:hypothetical protein